MPMAITHGQKTTSNFHRIVHRRCSHSSHCSKVTVTAVNAVAVAVENAVAQPQQPLDLRTRFSDIVQDPHPSEA